MAGECTKRIHALVLLLLVCFTIHAHCKWQWMTRHVIFYSRICFNIRSLIFPCFCFHDSSINHEYKSSICVKISIGRCIEADKEVQLAYIKKSQPIPRCCLDKHNDYCCSLNLACYDTIDQCTANCSISVSSATASSSSSSSVLPWNQIIFICCKERRMNKRQ